MRILFAAACLLSGTLAFAQEPKFEVASIKPTQSPATGRSLSHNAGARLTTSNATVKMLIMLAYQVMPYGISGGPGWLDGDGFDIEARGADPKATQEQFRGMIQGLLSDRFQLKVHHETRELPVYALVVAKNGAKLVEAKAEDPEEGLRIEAPGQMTGVKATMPMLATILSRPLQQKVLDETGLKGAYNFKLQFSPDQNASQSGENTGRSTSDSPSIFTALQEQLGLALKATKGPVDVLVIDHAEKPSEN